MWHQESPNSHTYDDPLLGIVRLRRTGDGARWMLYWQVPSTPYLLAGRRRWDTECTDLARAKRAASTFLPRLAVAE